jgi:uracil-DNA glycosylase
MDALQAIRKHQTVLGSCRLCPDMTGPVVMGCPVAAQVLLIGQAPGAMEGPAGKPFAWTAGKTLFKWFASIGLSEESFRSRVYMAAVCRCYPGKSPKGGDRVPSPQEVAHCSRWLDAELQILKPRLILPVGKLAIQRFLAFSRLTEVIGEVHRVPELPDADLIPLPHPSGASTWHRTQPGLGLLDRALGRIAEHPTWRELVDRQQP